MKNESSIEVDEDEIICNCFQVTESTIRTHIFKQNIAQVEDVTLLCEAGGNCGSCHMLIQLFIDQNKHKKTLEHAPEIIGKPMTITSGIRCEAFNSEIKGSLVSSHIWDGSCFNIACTTS